MDRVRTLPGYGPVAVAVRPWVAGLPPLWWAGEAFARLFGQGRLVNEERHPEWCSGGYRCEFGEHRSEPLRVPTAAGALVFTRVAGAGGAEFLEVRASVRLMYGTDQAAQLAAALDLAVRAVLAGDTEQLRPMIERVARQRTPRRRPI